MLLDSFFRIQSVIEHDETSPQGLPLKHYQVQLTVDPDHPIFGGHFPGNPVVPGVCQVQMIIETLCSVTKKKLKLAESDNIKFLTMINPLENPEISLDLMVKQPTGGHYSVQASLTGKNATFLKLKGNIIAE